MFDVVNYSIRIDGKDGKEVVSKQDHTFTLDEGQEVKGFEEGNKFSLYLVTIFQSEDSKRFDTVRLCSIEIHVSW